MVGAVSKTHTLQKPARTIPSAIKNSPALRCGNAQSVTKVACSRSRSCREAHPGIQRRSRIPHDEEDCFGIQIQLCRTSLAEPSEGNSVAKRVIPKKI